VPRHTANATDPAEGHEPASEPKPLGRIGALIAKRYRLESLVGTGAMGEVWRARHEELHTEVAVKLANRLSNEELAERMLERFRFEAQVTAQLSRHTDHVVAVQDAGRHRDVPFLAMEYVPGITLAKAIDRERTLEPERMAAILDQLTKALDVAHERGIWHRDIKPANIMLTPRTDGSEMVKLADFGVAKAIEMHLDVDKPRTTELGMLVGTPAYMSPEQIAGKVMDARGDLWSLAVCSYEALTGKEPFGALELSELLVAIAKHPVTPPSELARLPKALDGWFARALHKRPEKRFASGREMARAFRAAIARPEERFRWLLIAAAAVTGVTVAFALSSRASAARLQPRPIPIPTVIVDAPVPQPTAMTETEPQPEPQPATTTSSLPAPQIEKPAPSATPSSAPSHAYDKDETL
jgi:eukaryotic-like serine/threonine-protein kinase